VVHPHFCEVRGRRAILSNQVRECFRHAQDCMQQAAIQTDPKLRRDYLIIGACWLKLIREVSELPAEFSQGQQFTAPLKGRQGGENFPLQSLTSR
jgi:hypothetical protein